jgi:hypothetical protein
MALENLIVQTSFRENSPFYSDLINTVLSFSDDVCIDYNLRNPQNKDLIFLDGEAVSRRDIARLLKSINHETEFDFKKTQQKFLQALGEYESQSGIQLKNSAFKSTLPLVLDYNMFSDSNAVLVNANYTMSTTEIRYVGVLDYVVNYPRPKVEYFDYNLALDIIDEDINSQFLEGYVNLSKSDNWCKSIIENIAKIHNEKINIDTAMSFFVGVPLDIVNMAINKGINYTIENGYTDYKSHLTKDIEFNEAHRGKSHDVKIGTLLLPYYDISIIAYEKLCAHTGIQLNTDKFKQWHDWFFDGEYCRDMNSIPAVLNIISKLMFGQPYHPRQWNYDAQIVFDFAVEEKMDITNGRNAYQEYVNKCW